jgi:hypothetical protein
MAGNRVHVKRKGTVMYNYAQLNDVNICIGVSRLKGQVEDEKAIGIPTYSEDYIFRKYENGVWSEEKFLPVGETPGEDTIDTKLADAIAKLDLIIQTQAKMTSDLESIKTT